MKTKNHLLINFLIFLIAINIPYSLNLDFKKNAELIKEKISEDSQVKKIISLKQINSEINKGLKNNIILFYADWCHHW